MEHVWRKYETSDSVAGLLGELQTYWRDKTHKTLEVYKCRNPGLLVSINRLDLQVLTSVEKGPGTLYFLHSCWQKKIPPHRRDASWFS
jgi:hypothetical protein